jgi:8-oxo-dGTP pyrophosphatase MutT (NUDIX family)
MIEFKSNTIQAHIAALDNGEPKYLVIQRSSHVKLYPNIWQVVTGTIETNETALQTAIREVKEETGIVTQDIWTIPYITQFFDPYRNIIHASPVFGFLTDINTEILLSAEHQAYKWLPMDEISKVLPLPSHVEGTKTFHEYILKSKNISLYKVSTKYL